MHQYSSWISQLVRALARKSKGPGSSPGPRYNFSLSILHFNFLFLIISKFLPSWFTRSLRRGMVRRIRAFQAGGPGSIFGGVRIFLGLYVFHFLFLSCVVSCRDPYILPIIDSGGLALSYLSSVLVHSVRLHLLASEPRSFMLYVPGWG